MNAALRCLCVSCLLGIFTIPFVLARSSSTTPPLPGDGDGVIEQPPIFGDCDSDGALGIQGGSCGSCCSCDNGSTLDLGTDEAVLLHSGQEVRDATDLTLAGRDRATDLAIKRRHTTRRNQTNSMFGPAWAFNYRHTVLQLGDGSLSFRGYGREDVFVASTANVWDGTGGRVDRAIWDGASTLTVRRPHGTLMVFHVEGGAGALIGHMVELRSADGNSLQFIYEDGGAQPVLLERRMLGIQESYGRLLTILYGDPAQPTLATNVIDFSGREVVYGYDAQGNLTSVRSPLVTSTNGIDDFPEGKTRRYTYRKHSDPRLAHALTSVTFPNQVAQAAAVPVPIGTAPDRSRLRWTYVEDPSSPFFGFVESHTVGNTVLPSGSAAGGTFQYSYEYLPPAEYPAVIRTTVTDRRSTVTELELTAAGQITEERILTHGLRPNSPPEFVKTKAFDSNGFPTSWQQPLGGVEVVEYPDPAIWPRLSAANKVRRIRYPDSRGADQPSLVEQVVYEPVYNRKFKEISPRGFEPGNDPADYTTTYHLDYMEDLSGNTPALASGLGLSVAELQSLFSAAGVVDLGADVNGDGTRSRTAGHVVQIVHPPVALPPQASRFGLPANQIAVESFRHNDFGQLVYHKDAEENVHTWTYYGADDPDGDGVVDVPGADPTTGGFLHTHGVDTEPGAGRNSGQDPAPAHKLTTFEYTARRNGLFPANPRGHATAKTDARGVTEEYLLNELDQVVVEVRAAAVPAGSGLAAFAYQRTFDRDHNDNVVEIRAQNKDNLQGDDDFVVGRRTYDVLDAVRSQTLDVGGLDQRRTFSYDPSGNLVALTRGAGTPDAATETWTHDERNIFITYTLGAGSEEAATVSTRVDGNGNIVANIDATGDEVVTDFDGFDRERQVTDRMGNRTVLAHDSNGNVLSDERHGMIPGFVPGEVLLAKSEFRYDARDRQYREDEHLFQYPGHHVGTLDDGAFDPGDGLVSRVQVFDRSGRVVGEVDADGDATETRYDGAGRVIYEGDDLGNSESYAYDGNDNLTARVISEASPLVSGPEVFVYRYRCDALNRRYVGVEPNGQTVRYEYDSSNNRIRSTDNLGNVIEHRFDRLDRETRVTQYLSASGLGATAATADPNQGGGDGRITVEKSWDALGRLASQTDDSGNVTAYGYDDLDRRISEQFGDGTSISREYNGDSELLTRTDQRGSVSSWGYNKNGLPTSFGVVNADGTVVGSVYKAWSYDGMGRVWSDLDLNDRADPEDDVGTTLIRDSLGRVVREVQAIGSLPAAAVDSGYQGHDRLVSETYPNGRVVRRSYDALDRLAGVTDASTGASITHYDYVGTFRVLVQSHGNGTVLDKRNDEGSQTFGGTSPGYDDNRRTVLQRWKTSSGSDVVSYASVFNGPSGRGTNRRVSETRAHLFGHSDSYAFDSAYRQIGFLRNGSHPSSRVLDGADKMLAFDDEGVDRNPVVDGDPGEAGLNQYSSFGGGARVYDAKGGLASDGLGATYLHDSQGRLVQAFDGTTEVGGYVYDARGRRVLKRVEGQPATRYVYRGWRVVEEQSEAGATLRQYVDGSGLDEHVQLRLYQGSGWSDYYYHANSQGSIGALTDSLGGAVEYYEYKWLGSPLILDSDKTTPLAASKVGNAYAFQGRRLDPETGLYYFRHRFLDPVAGEFRSLDPLGIFEHLQGNGYSAFGEDPWNREDPRGLDGGALSVVLGGLGSDLLAPEPSDLVPGKWIGWGVAVIGAGLITLLIESEPTTATPSDPSPEPRPERDKGKKKDKKKGKDKGTRKGRPPKWRCTTKARGCCKPGCGIFLGFGPTKAAAKATSQAGCYGAGCNTPGGDPWNCQCGHATCTTNFKWPVPGAKRVR